ncbi:MULTISPECIES: hypothetical protein [unclassified Streptomyces]|uniref:hypothetical protein n=1 Tax=unclassified Streptomyces TaxID=2593676 RepID=UPI002FDBA977
MDKVADTIATPFKKKEASAKKSARKTDKKPTSKPPARKVPPPKPAPPLHKPKPSPAVARERLMEKLQDMYWLQRKWDAAAMSKRINKMTDAQVYAALDMSENDIETAARANPRSQPEYAAPDDPNSNILWYHGGESMIV